MKLTRQHFQLIAEVVSEIENKSMRHTVAMNFVLRLQKTNPGFKAKLFLDACNAGNVVATVRPVREDTRDDSRAKESFIAP